MNAQPQLPIFHEDVYDLWPNGLDVPLWLGICGILCCLALGVLCYRVYRYRRVVEPTEERLISVADLEQLLHVEQLSCALWYGHFVHIVKRTIQLEVDVTESEMLGVFSDLERGSNHLSKLSPAIERAMQSKFAGQTFDLVHLRTDLTVLQMIINKQQSQRTT